MVRKTRTMLQRAQAIFALLDYYPGPLAKSQFQDVGISPREIDQWLELIQYIQKAPRLEVTRKGKRTYVDIMENKFMLFMRQKYLNQAISDQEREGAILLYFKVMLTFERLKGADVDMESILNYPFEIDRPTIIRLAEDAINELDD